MRTHSEQRLFTSTFGLRFAKISLTVLAIDMSTHSTHRHFTPLTRTLHTTYGIRFLDTYHMAQS